MKTNPISALGGWVLGIIGGVGFFTRFFGAVLARSGIAIRRPRLSRYIFTPHMFHPRRYAARYASVTGMSLRLAVVPLVSANISTRLSASSARVSPV